MTKFGFLGLGIMGSAMASNLVKAGYDVTVWNRTADKCTPVTKLGAAQGASPADVVRNSDITFAIVSDPAAAEALCFGPNGVLEGITPGKSYIDASTVDPSASIKIGNHITEKGGRFLEAPVSGSKKPAEDGTLVFLCAGDQTLYREALPALDIMGKKSFFLGDVGTGAQMKLIINMTMGIMMTALGEGLSLGQAVGLDPADVLNVIKETAIQNPVFQFKGPKVIEGDFTTAFPLKHMQKDMRLAVQLGKDHQLDLHSAAEANALFLKAIEAGCADDDFSAVYKVIVGRKV